jgi:alanyl-tRNA synthetase
VGYRSKRELPWPVRVVEIPGYDKCACCGVHVAATGEVGLIKLISCVKFHQGVRIEMVCGDRALALVDRIWEQNRKISQMLSAKLPETAAAVEYLKEQLAKEKLKSSQQKKQIFRTLADNYRGKGNVLHIEPGLEAGEVRELADAIGQVCGGIAVVASGEDDLSYSLCLISRTADVRPLGKEAFAALQGRGGGRADSVQGSVKATEARIRDFFAVELGKIL